MDIRLLDLLLDHILSILLMFPPGLILHPLELLEEPSIFREVLHMLLFILADNARESQLMFHFYL